MPFASAVPLRAVAAGDVTKRIAAIEARTGGRLGVAALDTAGARSITYRAHERFPMCSTFKLLAAGAVLARVDRGEERLDRRIAYGTADLLAYAPVAKAHAAQGFMTVEALCAAAVTMSDNTAANLLLRTLGGPAGVTHFARSLGDAVTRLDRTEPTLNTGLPGDPRDTTAPAAMAANLHALVLGNGLTPASRARLTGWLVGNRTGDDLVRAGVPAGWRVGDKTGLGGATNAHGDSSTRNDVAIAWPPHRAPLIMAVYLTQVTVAAQAREAAIADVARAVVTALA